MGCFMHGDSPWSARGKEQGKLMSCFTSPPQGAVCGSCRARLVQKYCKDNSRHRQGVFTHAQQWEAKFSLVFWIGLSKLPQVMMILLCISEVPHLENTSAERIGELLGFEGYQVRCMTGLLTGSCCLNWHLFLLGLVNEISLHALCGLWGSGSTKFFFFFMKPGDCSVKRCTLSKAWDFQEDSSEIGCTTDHSCNVKTGMAYPFMLIYFIFQSLWYEYSHLQVMKPFFTSKSDTHVTVIYLCIVPYS
jgi:hypothetical protein